MATVVTKAGPSTTKVPGQLHYSDLDRLWQDHTPSVRPALLRFMHAYEVAFPALDRDGNDVGFSVVPAMLRRHVPTLDSRAARSNLLYSDAEGDEQVRQQHNRGTFPLPTAQH